MKRLVVLLGMDAVLLFSGLLMAQEQQLYLPFPAGTTYRCVQGANGSYSHRSVYTRYDLDFDTPNDSDERVVAPVSGIAYVHPNKGSASFGNHINIDIGNNLFVMVAHLRSYSVQNKEVVIKGQVIGTEGTTGFSQGDHIHFGLHRGDAKKDALESESIRASFIWALDITRGDTEYRGYKSEDFVGDLYAGHFYKSNNDYNPGSLLALCPTGFKPSNDYRLDPSAVLVLGESGWHPT